MHLALAIAVAISIAIAVTWCRFAADVRAHRARVRRGSRVVETALGPIEVATIGAGPPVLVSHGFGGGFDHVDTQRLVDAGFEVIAPSRFGYLRSPLPNDASPEKQADVFAALLDELGIERVAVVGISTGALSAMCFAARHPQRCRSLVVVVPTLGTEPHVPLATSDLGHWLALRLAGNALVRSILGTEPFVVEAASEDERLRARDLVTNALPIRERLAGMNHDRRTMSAPPSIAFDRIEAPALVVATKDDRHGTHDAARLVAESIRGARLVTYRTGGHAWIGRDGELFEQMLALLLRTSLALTEPRYARGDRMTPDYARVMARYNRWMNEKLYAVTEKLSDGERKQDRGAFFGSIHRTLNHLLLADRVWLGRFTGAKLEEGEFGPGGIKSLDQELYSEFEELRRERKKTDDEIDAYVATLTDEKLAANLRYLRRGAVNEFPLWQAVAHLFNHQTHHRGQVTTLLMQAGHDPGVTDLIAMLRA